METIQLNSQSFNVSVYNPNQQQQKKVKSNALQNTKRGKNVQKNQTH